MSWKLALKKRKIILMLLTLGLIYHSFSLDFWTWLELLGVFQDTKNTVTMVFAGPPAGLPEIVCNNCSYVNYPIRLTPQCSPVFLLILVASRTANRKQRDLIRTTWAQQSRSQEVGTIFILGRNHIAADSVILHESEKYHDIVQFDFLDTYKNLTIKTVSALKWAKYNCPSVRYILKTDDDTFNNIPGILKFIHSAHLTNSMSGVVSHMLGNAKFIAVLHSTICVSLHLSTSLLFRIGIYHSARCSR